MQIIFQVFKGLFFIVTIFVALLFAVGKIIFNPQAYVMSMLLLIPWYLLLLGLMIGYILSNIQAAKYSKYPDFLNNIYKRGLVIGIVLGVILVVIYLGLYYIWKIIIG